jgi:Ca2+/Na+ antiporter
MTLILTKDDFLQFQLFTASQSPSIAKRRNRNRIMVSLLYVVIALTTFLRGQLNFAVVILVFSGLWFVLYPLYSAWYYKRHYSKHIDEHYKEKIGSSSQLSISCHGLEAEGNAISGSIAFNGMGKLFEIPGYFFLQVETGDYLIFPKSNEETAEFVQELEKAAGLTREVLEHWKWK